MTSREAQSAAPAAAAPPAWYLALVQESQQTLAADDRRRGAMRRRVAEIVAMERGLEEALGRQVERIAAPPPAAAAVRRFHGTVSGQRATMEAHLERLGGTPAGQGAAGTGDHATGDAGEGDARDPHAVPAALRDDYAAFAHAAVSYTMLHHTARIFFDIATGEVAEAHLRAYAGAAQEVTRLMADVVAWAFRQEGQRCLCRCPGCALGACLCVANTTAATEQAWRESAPAPPEGGVAVVCTASRPATLDLQDGDVLTAVDGHPVQAWPDAIVAILEHAPGDPVRLQIERGGVPVALTATRP